MRLSRCLTLPLLLLPGLMLADSKNPADYPMRVHIFNRSETSFYSHRYVEEAKGEGRANLFEAGDVHGLDFTFDCSQKIKGSFGYETYPAKWKKPGKEITLLLPVFGKSGSFFTCDIKTDVKSYAYASHQGSLSSESPAEFKAWMVKHDYDPEHGKDMPTKLPPKPAEPPPAAAPPQQQQP